MSPTRYRPRDPADGPDAVRLARFIESTPGLDFQGLLFYPGHIHPEYDQDTHKLQELDSELRKQLELFEKEKIPVPRVSGGSTPSAFHSHHISGLTEIRPGTYIFNDRNTIEWGSCKEEHCAAAVLCTVVSIAVPREDVRIIVDHSVEACETHDKMDAEAKVQMEKNAEESKEN